MAILSNKADQFMAEVVDNYFSAWSFEVVFGARHGIPVKPDPASALEVASIMQLATSEIIYIGDSDVDMKTAHGANMLAIGAGWGLRGREELLANGAHAVIEHPLELLNWFN
jgi:phosphoglycolate phosphatase